MTSSCTHNESAAFQQVLLKSERLRILIVLCTIGAALLLRTIRTAIVAAGLDLSPGDLLVLATDGFFEWAQFNE
jgi:hypothetical protein